MARAHSLLRFERKEVKTQTTMLVKRVIEYFEARFRSYRFSDKDVEVMDKKGYYFDANTGRFRKEKGKRGWYFNPNKPYKSYK